jgi:hypothetical protein
MTINRIFLFFMSAVGVAAGLALVARPELRDFRVSPYFWILIAMALFEIGAFARGRGEPGTTGSDGGEAARFRSRRGADGRHPGRRRFARSIVLSRALVQF